MYRSYMIERTVLRGESISATIRYDFNSQNTYVETSVFLKISAQFLTFR